VPVASLGRSIRFLRRHRGWCQRDLASRCGVSQQTISRVEADRLEGIDVPLLRRIVSALDGHLVMDLRYAGEALSRLVDADHAWLQDWLAALLRGAGWSVRVELSFNHYGDRGRYDVIAFHPEMRALLVVEVKTEIRDAQETLGRLDIKVRLARRVATAAGWNAAAIVPALIVADGRTAQRRVGDHPALFGGFPCRGRQATAWLRRPRPPVPDGLLAFIRVPITHATSADRS
jgi:transcriptional regulator with XRE-family HTH domain